MGVRTKAIFINIGGGGAIFAIMFFMHSPKEYFYFKADEQGYEVFKLYPKSSYLTKLDMFMQVVVVVVDWPCQSLILV